MSFTTTNVIDSARVIMVDPDKVRNSDAALLICVNDGIKEIAIYRPEFFLGSMEFTCEVGECLQSIAYEDAVALREVRNVVGGGFLTQFDVAAMDLFRPAWRLDTAGPAIQWAPIVNDPRRFYIYPKAPSAQSLLLDVIKNPSAYALDAVVDELPDLAMTALVDYVVWRAESKDDASVVSARAQAYYQSFLTKIGANAAAAKSQGKGA